MLHEVHFPSYNLRDEVQGWVYVPAQKPKGIIQLVHGFGEHSRRYFRMIVRFMDAGFIVAADDHVGHGKTAIVNDCWGDWGAKGYEVMREDEHALSELVRRMYPDLPLFMFGHSMGSFIARDYAAHYGDELSGLVICGTSGVFPNLEKGKAMLKAAVDAGKGEEPHAEAAGVLLGWMFARCEEGVKLGNEWICHDPCVQADHAEDPFDAFTKPTSARSFLYFCEMIEVITGEDWARKVPVSLPIYNIAGDQDPVGQYGAGVYQVSNWLIDSGHRVTTKLYTGYRHEIHNYREIQGDVEDGIVAFINGVLEG